MVVLNHSWIAAMYLAYFAGVRVTVLFSISHTKPMNTGDKENGVSLEGFQGIPSWSVMQFMCSKLYVCVVQLLPG